MKGCHDKRMNVFPNHKADSAFFINRYRLRVAARCFSWLVLMENRFILTLSFLPVSNVFRMFSHSLHFCLHKVHLNLPSSFWPPIFKLICKPCRCHLRFLCSWQHHANLFTVIYFVTPVTGGYHPVVKCTFIVVKIMGNLPKGR